MFRTLFVARIKPEQKEVDIHCRFDAPSSESTKLADLPSVQNLGNFCYPVGAANVKPREYSAPEVSCGAGSKLCALLERPYIQVLPYRSSPSPSQVAMAAARMDSAGVGLAHSWQASCRMERLRRVC